MLRSYTPGPLASILIYLDQVRIHTSCGKPPSAALSSARKGELLCPQKEIEEAASRHDWPQTRSCPEMLFQRRNAFDVVLLVALGTDTCLSHGGMVETSCFHHHVQMSLGCFVHGKRLASCKLQRPGFPPLQMWRNTYPTCLPRCSSPAVP